MDLRGFFKAFKNTAPDYVDDAVRSSDEALDSMGSRYAQEEKLAETFLDPVESLPYANQANKSAQESAQILANAPNNQLQIGLEQMPVRSGGTAMKAVDEVPLPTRPAALQGEVLDAEYPVGAFNGGGGRGAARPDINSNAVPPLQLEGPTGGMSPFQKILLGSAGVGATAVGLNAMNQGKGKQPAGDAGISREDFYPGYPKRMPDREMPAELPGDGGLASPSNQVPNGQPTLSQAQPSPSLADAPSMGFTENTVEGLRNAQQQAADARFVNELGRGSELIGTAISGAKPVAQEIFTQQAKDSDKVVKSFEERAEKEKSDPKSAISQQFRDFVKKFGVELPSNTSAEAAAKVMPYAYQKFAAQEAQAARAHEAGLERDLRRDIAKEAAEARKDAADVKKSSKLTDQQAIYGEKIAKVVQNKEYDKYSKLHNVVARMRSAVAKPGAISDGTLVYDLVKTLDPDTGVREGEISFVGALASVPDRARKAMSKAWNGESLTSEQRQQILDFGKTTLAQQKATWEVSAKPALLRADKLGIDRSYVLPEDFEEVEDEEAPAPAAAPQGKAPASQELVKVIPPGGGKAKLIPRDQVQAAVSAGGKVVQ